MVAGLALLFKQIDAFLQIAQFIFLALVSLPVSLSGLARAGPHRARRQHDSRG